MTHPDFTDAVLDLQARWSRAFGDADWPALIRLFAPSAQLYGSKPGLFQGHARLHEYFSVVQPGVTVAFGDTAVVAASPDVTVAAGLVTFVLGEQRLSCRLSWTLARSGGDWFIASHHASPIVADGG